MKSLSQQIILKESLKMLENYLCSVPKTEHYAKAEIAWKALSFWRKIRSKRKYINKKAWEFYQSDQNYKTIDLKNTISIRKPKRYSEDK